MVANFISLALACQIHISYCLIDIFIWLSIRYLNANLFDLPSYSSFFLALGDRSKKILLQFISKSVLPMLSSKNLMISGLTFHSLIHLSLFLNTLLENVLISFF